MSTAEKIKQLETTLARLKEIQELEAGTHLFSQTDPAYCNLLLPHHIRVYKKSIAAIAESELSENVVIACYEKDLSATIIEQA